MRNLSQTARRRNLAYANGFTLLEVVLALGIASVLVFAAYQAMMMHYVQLESGREIAERAQLVRALSARIKADLRSTFTAWEPAEALADDESTSVASISGAAIPPGGVYGETGLLTLVTQSMPVDLDFSPNVSSAAIERKSDVRMIRYYLGNDERFGPGLIREVYDQLPDPELGSEPFPARTDFLAEEIAEFDVRFFDGSDWLENWGLENDAAPAAVQVRLGMLPRRRRGEDPANDPTSLEYYQFTVAMPRAIPVEAVGASSSPGPSEEEGEP